MRSRFWLLILGAAASNALLVGACTFGTEVFGVTVKNDLPFPVEVRRCNDGPICHDVYERELLNPGGKWELNVSNGGAVDWLRVFDQDGQTTGCIRLEFHERITGVVFELSQTEPCPKDQ